MDGLGLWDIRFSGISETSALSLSSSVYVSLSLYLSLVSRLFCFKGLPLGAVVYSSTDEVQTSCR